MLDIYKLSNFHLSNFNNIWNCHDSEAELHDK